MQTYRPSQRKSGSHSAVHAGRGRRAHATQGIPTGVPAQTVEPAAQTAPQIAKRGTPHCRRGVQKAPYLLPRDLFPEDPHSGDPPKLLMTAATWTKYLWQTKIGKAVPQGCAPAAAWKVCSDMLGPYLESISLAVEEEGVLPSKWCSPELIWLTKPNKAPDTPEHLRPIGLLSPTAKAAAASVRELLMPGIQRLLTAVPQFAYLANRDIYDALARVNGQLASIKHSLALTVSNRFVQRQRREEATGTGRWLQPISGGAVLSVDLHKAFDLLTREQLQSTLSKIVADEGVKQTALLLHTKCQYLLFQEGKATAVDTTRGVRQVSPCTSPLVGCLGRLAPPHGTRPIHGSYDHIRRRSSGCVDLPHPGRHSCHGERRT